jgi:hypothetical protein
MEKLHMQYDTIMGMLFYEFQNVLETYSTILEERREEEEKEYAEQESKYSNYTPENMMRNAQNYIPNSSMSNIPQMPSMPKIDIPKF